MGEGVSRFIFGISCFRLSVPVTEVVFVFAVEGAWEADFVRVFGWF